MCVCSVLAEFQSRKAHRVQIRDKDLFKYLCCLLVVVVGYMSAWTAVTLDHTGSRGSILQTGVTDDNLIYVVCQSKWWDYVIETGAFLMTLTHSRYQYDRLLASSCCPSVRLCCCALWLNDTSYSSKSV